MGIRVLLCAFGILTALAHAGWVSLSANIPWPNDSMDLSSACFIGNEGWITASYWGDTGFVYHTTDGGQSFETQHTQYPAYSVHMVSRLDGYACGASGRVYRTTDAGANWNTLGTITTTATCIDFPPGCDTGYCCGDNGNIARVTPDGVTRMPNPSGTTNLKSLTFPVTPGEGWACGENVIIHCLGDSWRADQTYDYGAYSTISFADNHDGWAGGDLGKILHTTDGYYWVAQTNPDSLRQRSLYASSFIDSNYGWIVGFEGIIERTIDGGQNWRIEADGMTDHFLAGVFAVDTGTAYVVGNLKAFLKYDGRGGIEESPKPQASSSKLGPTIARGVLLVPPLLSPLSSLLSIDGRKVLDLKAGANDVSRLAPGVYFVRAVSRELSAASCHKVVLTR